MSSLVALPRTEGASLTARQAVVLRAPGLLRHHAVLGGAGDGQVSLEKVWSDSELTCTPQRERCQRPAYTWCKWPCTRHLTWTVEAWLRREPPGPKGLEGTGRSSCCLWWRG